MSEESGKRHWFTNLFYPSAITSAKSESALASSFTSRQFLPFSPTDPVDIVKPVQQYKKEKDTFSSYKSLSKKFAPLQRLDSVGGVESEQTRFSYPPASGIVDDYLMGNRLQTMWPDQALSDQNMTIPSNLSTATAPSKDPISFVNSCFVSSLRKISGTISRSITSFSDHKLLPQSSNFPLTDTEVLHNLSDKVVDKSLKQQSDSMNSLPSTCVLCCSSHIGIKADATKCLRNHKVELVASVQTALHDVGSEVLDENVAYCAVNCDSFNTEITLMSQECFNEVQKHAAPEHQCLANDSSLNTEPVDSTTGNVKSAEGSLSPSPIVESDDLTCKDKMCNDESIYVCKNPLIARILGCTSDCDSDMDNVSVISTQCEDDADGMSDFSSIDSSDSEESFEETDEDREDCDSSAASTDTEEDECPWERIVSCRAPWTCNRRRKRKPQLRSFNITPECDSEKFDDESNEKKSHFHQRDDVNASNFTYASSDNCSVASSCEGVEFDSFESNDRYTNTVNRPKCSNSDISFILGWPHDDSDSDDDSVIFESVVDDRFASISTDLSNKSLKRNISKSYDKPASISSTDDSCFLWDYFMKQRDPILNLSPPKSASFEDNCNIAKTVIVPTTSEGDLSKKCDAPSYKASTKVRFCDEIKVHPMIAWAFAYREARKGSWECCVRDRSRFMMRIANVEKEISWCLHPDHRAKIVKKRSTGL